MSAERAATFIQEVPRTAALAKHSNRSTILFSFFSIWIIWGSTYLAIRYPAGGHGTDFCFRDCIRRSAKMANQCDACGRRLAGTFGSRAADGQERHDVR